MAHLVIPAKAGIQKCMKLLDSCFRRNDIFEKNSIFHHSPYKEIIMLKRQQMRLEDFDYSNQSYVYFLTLCSKRGASPFYAKELAGSVIDSLKYIRNLGDMLLYCYCLMPDHLHIAMSPRKGSVSDVIGRYKSYTTRMAWVYGFDGTLWQRSYYDHVARSEENLLNICKYILGTSEKLPFSVIPAKAGIQNLLKLLDSCFRRNDT